jgi:hypothetical protein
MARTYHPQWQENAAAFTPGSLCDIARTGPSRRPEAEQSAGLEPTNNQGDAMRRRVWRALTWIVFANVLAFWLLTCITAFTQV